MSWSSNTSYLKKIWWTFIPYTFFIHFQFFIQPSFKFNIKFLEPNMSLINLMVDLKIRWVWDVLKTINKNKIKVNFVWEIIFFTFLFFFKLTIGCLITEVVPLKSGLISKIIIDYLMRKIEPIRIFIAMAKERDYHNLYGTA
jgi:hypothetical protein